MDVVLGARNDRNEVELTTARARSLARPPKGAHGRIHPSEP